MASELDTHPDDGQRAAPVSARIDAATSSQGLTSSQKAWCLAVGVLLVIWFFIAWLALDRHVLDAAGESVGTGFGLLVLVSIIGAVRGRD
jgi:hypothetical protein